MQLLYFITPHAQRERGKVIGLGVVVYVCGQKKFESYFSDRLTFSNIRGRTSRRIYRLVSNTAFSRNTFLIE